MKKLKILIVLMIICSQAKADLSSEQLKVYCQQLNIKGGYIASAKETCNLTISYEQIYKKIDSCALDTGINSTEILRLTDEGRSSFVANKNTPGACETARKIVTDYFDQQKINKSEQRSENKHTSKEDTKCKNDLQCLGQKNILEASVYCAKGIEKLSTYSFRWVDGFLEQKFSGLRWLDKEKGIITYAGDKIEIQNNFETYQNYIYECDFDTASQKVIETRAYPGRL